MHPYRSASVEPRVAPAERGSLGLALGILAVVSLIQLVTAYHHAGVFAGQTLIGAAFLAAGVLGLSKSR